jgi:hypothetical protein
LQKEREEQLWINEKAAVKALNEQEAQRKRFDRAMAAQARQEAKAQKQADRLRAKEAKEAQVTLQKQFEACASAPRKKSNK